MNSNYGIFKWLPRGGIRWISVIETLDAAKARLDQLVRSSDGEYYLYNLQTGELLARSEGLGKRSDRGRPEAKQKVK